MTDGSQAPWPDNRLVITGCLADNPHTRVSPGGIPVSRFTIGHVSQQPEGGSRRQVGCRVRVHARGAALQSVIGMLRAGSPVRVFGYLGPAGYRPEQQRLVVVARRIQLVPNSETQGVE